MENLSNKIKQKLADYREKNSKRRRWAEEIFKCIVDTLKEFEKESITTKVDGWVCKVYHLGKLQLTISITIDCCIKVVQEGYEEKPTEYMMEKESLLEDKLSEIIYRTIIGE